jgi:hypothetical protein
MNLTELKPKPINELVEMADGHGARERGPLAQAGHHLLHAEETREER